MSDNSHKDSEGYLEVALIVERSFEELLSNFIIEEIAFGLATEDLNSHVKIIFYLPLSDNPQEKLNKVKKYLSLMEILPPEQIEEKLSSKKIRDIDWINEYKKGFKSIVLDDLVVKTPWDMEKYPDRRIITLEPKMAFGTGKHETTQLCLHAIRQEITPGIKMLDLGTGSGILSIYAAMLGASEILGLDIDPDSVPNALENAEVNGVSHIFSAQHGSMEKVTQTGYYDMVVSNLIFDGIVELFDRFLEALKPGGKIIISGILDMQEEQLTKFIEKRISADMKITRLNEWLCFILRT